MTTSELLLLNPMFWLTHNHQRLRTKPHEYACIGCEQKVTDHETIFETRESRLRRGANIDHAYIPLSDNDYLTSQVIDGKGKLGGRARRPVLGNNPHCSTSLPAIKNSPAVFNPDTPVVRYRWSLQYNWALFNARCNFYCTLFHSVYVLLIR